MKTEELYCFEVPKNSLQGEDVEEMMRLLGMDTPEEITDYMVSVASKVMRHISNGYHFFLHDPDHTHDMKFMRVNFGDVRNRIEDMGPGGGA